MSTPKKILFLTHYFYPRIGGVEKHVLSISLKLIEMGYEVSIITSMHDSALNEFETYQGIKIIRININTSWQKPSKTLLWRWTLKNIGLFANSDIIHCHDVFFWTIPIRLLSPSKKIFTTFHGYETKYPIPHKNIFVRKVSEIMSNGNICVGSFISKWYGTNPDIVTYGAVNCAKHITIKPCKKSFLFLGRLDPDSQITTFLSGIDILKKKGYTFDIEFAGDGSMANIAKKYGKVHGFVKNPVCLIKQKEYIFTSGYLSLLESYINKRLVFCAYDNPLKRDYYLLSPHKNFVVLSNNPTAFSVNFINIISNLTEKEKRIESAYKWAKKQTWSKLTNQYISLWTKGSR